MWKWEWRDNYSAEFEDVDVRENEQDDLSDDGGTFDDGTMNLTALAQW